MFSPHTTKLLLNSATSKYLNIEIFEWNCTSCVTCARAGSHKGSQAVYPVPHSKDGGQEPPVTKPPISSAVFTPPCLPLTQSKPSEKTPKLLPHLCCCSTSSRRLLPSLLLPLLLYMQVLGCVCWKGLMALLAAREEED